MGNLKEKEFVKKYYGDSYLEQLMKSPFNEFIDKADVRSSVRHTLDLGYLIQMLNIPPGSKILEMGCGSGWISTFLAKLNFKVHCIDISREMIEVTKERAKRENLLKNITFTISDFDTFSSKDKFDAVLFYDCLHHSEDKFKTIKNAYNNLKDNGIVVLFEPNWIHGHKYKNHIDECGRLEQGLFKYKWTKLIKKAGFKKVETFYSIERLYRKSVGDFLKHAVRVCYESTPFDFSSRILLRAVKKKVIL